jgi:predicted SnoaL-like aldol condensation-catalyzing enzyme
MNSNLKLIKDYFYFFSKKNINELKNIFHKNIILKDWQGAYKGLSAVIKKNNDIFCNCKKIKIKIINIIKKNNLFCIQLKIFINTESKPIKVIDLITINNNKIKKIEAYKG